MTKITGKQVYDWRFPTSIQSDGSDAVHKDPDVRAQHASVGLSHTVQLLCLMSS